MSACRLCGCRVLASFMSDKANKTSKCVFQSSCSGFRGIPGSAGACVSHVRRQEDKAELVSPPPPPRRGLLFMSHVVLFVVGSEARARGLGVGGAPSPSLPLWFAMPCCELRGRRPLTNLSSKPPLFLHVFYGMLSPTHAVEKQVHPYICVCSETQGYTNDHGRLLLPGRGPVCRLPP